MAPESHDPAGLAVTEISLSGRKPAYRGKVRDIYDLGDSLLVVATDRISAFDCVFPNGIPGKGRVLTQLSAFWFSFLDGIVPHHFLELPNRNWLAEFTGGDIDTADRLEDRSMRVRKCKPLPVECIVRGNLEGSGWKEYQQTGKIMEHELPSGLSLHDPLPEPIFTPSTKAAEGNDRNITFSEMKEIVEEELADRMRQLSVAIYSAGRQSVVGLGITLADTKFEFGLDEAGELTLIDEVLTPDSSRFLVSDGEEGAPRSLDKQFMRDWAEALPWDKTPPAPEIPKDVVTQTAARYADILKRVSGR